MLKRLSCVVVLAAFLTMLPMGYSEPRDGWSLEDRVPATALALVSIEDVGSMGARFEKTAIAGLFREPEMQAFAAPIVKALEEMALSEDKSPLGPATPLIMKLLEQLQGLQGQVAVCLLDVDVDSGMPRAVASLDFGAHVGDFAAFMEGLRKELDPEGNAIAAFEKDGRTWWQHRGDGPPLTATTVDTAFVLATDAELLETVVAGGVGDSLGSHPDFASVRRRAGGSALGLFLYGNVPAIVDKVEPMMDDEARVIADALGLDTVKAVAYGLAFAGDGFMDSLILHAPGADHGLLTLVDMPALRPRALTYAPANAVYFDESSLNLDSLLTNIRGLAARVEPRAVAELDRGLEQASNALGVDIEKELLAGLAGGVASYVAMPDTGGLYPEIAIFLEVKDPAVFQGVFERFTRGVAGVASEQGGIIASTRTLDYRGQRLNLFEMQAAHGDDVVPFTPTWTLLDNWCVITLVPHAMKEIVLRAQGARTVTGGGLAAQEDFQSLLRVMPPEAGALTYVDMQAVLNLLYDTGVPLLQTAVKPNVLGRKVPFPLDWAQLPAARTVRPYFRSLGVFTTWNDDGVAVRMHGPIPLVGVLAVGAAVAVPWLVMGGSSEVRSVTAREGRFMPPRPPEPKPPRAPVRVQPAPKSRIARVQAEQLSSYVRVFLLTENRLPSSLEEMVAKDVTGAIPKDPWGKNYVLKILDEKARKFRVLSAGPDGVFETDDDIHSGR